MRHDKFFNNGKVRITVWLTINGSRVMWVNEVLPNKDAATPSEILEAKLELWNKVKPC